MEPVTQFLVACAGILLIGATAELVFNRTGIPDVLFLVLAGMLLGPAFKVVAPELAQAIVPYIGALALVVILFDSGTRLKAADLAKAPRAVPLALLAFSLSAVTVAGVSVAAAAAGWLPAQWTWSHGLLLGAILGGPSSSVIAPVLERSRLDSRMSDLLNLESALSDILCVAGTSALAYFLLAEKTGAGQAMRSALGLGLGAGVVTGLVWMLFLRALRLSQHAYPITLAVLLLTFVMIERAGGSPVLGVLSLSIVLGNAPDISRLLNLPAGMELGQDVIGFHRQVIFAVKAFLFIMMGALIPFSWPLAALGILLTGGLLLARVPPVQISTAGSSLSQHERMLIATAFPRGLAAVVLAVMVSVWQVPETTQIPGAVVACVLGTLFFHALGYPLARRMTAKAAAAAAVPVWQPSPPSPPPPDEPPPRPPLTTGKFHW